MVKVVSLDPIDVSPPSRRELEVLTLATEGLSARLTCSLPGAASTSSPAATDGANPPIPPRTAPVLASVGRLAEDP
jgi:hypothetical protein